MRRLILSALIISILSTILSVTAFADQMEKVQVVKPPFRYGDVNGDGKVNTGDFTLLRRFILRIIDKFDSPDGLKAADVNGDGVINGGDYTLMRRYILNIIDVFPVEEQAEEVVSAFCEGNNRFALDIFRQVNKEDVEKNIFISPISISTALSMVYQGAGGDTRDEMAKTLGYEGISMSDLNRSYKSLLDHLRLGDEKVELKINNSIWINEDYLNRTGTKIKESFIETNKSIFDALVSIIDFTKENAAGSINSWIIGATNGKIQYMIDPDALRGSIMCLVNAIYFNGEWKQEFNEKETRPDNFKIGGSTILVDMMRKGGYMDYGQGSDFSVVRLPYGNGKTSMYCMLPGVGMSIDEFVQNLDETKWKTIKQSMYRAAVNLELPKFKMEYGVKELTDTFKTLGIRSAFGDANFTGITDEGICIEKVLHKAVIEVDEKGSEAAGVTVIQILPSVGPGSHGGDNAKWFRANRPFVFAIVDDEYDTILFMGKMKDPSMMNW